MQRSFNFMTALKAPQNAPQGILSQIQSADQAMRVSVMRKGLKAAYYANEMHISPGYFSRILTGQRQMPEWFVEPFCSLTGSNLLKQYLSLQYALKSASGDLSRNAIERHMAEELRKSA